MVVGTHRVLHADFVLECHIYSNNFTYMARGGARKLGISQGMRCTLRAHIIYISFNLEGSVSLMASSRA